MEQVSSCECVMRARIPNSMTRAVVREASAALIGELLTGGIAALHRARSRDAAIRAAGRAELASILIALTNTGATMDTLCEDDLSGRALEHKLFLARKFAEVEELSGSLR